MSVPSTDVYNSCETNCYGKTNKAKADKEICKLKYTRRRGKTRVGAICRQPGYRQEACLS